MRNHREQTEPRSYIYNETGTSEVAQQILDSYNSGVVDSKYTESNNEE